jgi:hypothetical protein
MWMHQAIKYAVNAIEIIACAVLVEKYWLQLTGLREHCSKMGVPSAGIVPRASSPIPTRPAVFSKKFARHFGK